jgi:membrane protease YdiL (CAAX protease family)
MSYPVLLIAALLTAVSFATYLHLFRSVYTRRTGKVDTEPLTWVDVVFASVLILYIAFQTFAHLESTTLPNPSHFSGQQLIIATLTSWTLILGPIFISLRVRGIRISRLFGLNRLPILRVLAWGAGLLFAALPLIFGSSEVISEYLQNRADREPQEIIQIFREATHVDQRISIILLAVVIAPVAEELVFRGYLYTVLKRFFGGLPSLVFNGVLFGLVHVNVPALLPLFLLGCTFTIAYEMTGSLFVPMTMHALFNAINLVAVLFFPHEVS